MNGTLRGFLMGRGFYRDEFLGQAYGLVEVIGYETGPDLEHAIQSNRVLEPLWNARATYQFTLGLLLTGSALARADDEEIACALEDLAGSRYLLGEEINKVTRHVTQRTQKLDLNTPETVSPQGIITYQQDGQTYTFTCAFSDGLLDFQKSALYITPTEDAERVHRLAIPHETRVIASGDVPFELALMKGVLWYENKLKEK